MRSMQGAQLGLTFANAAIGLRAREATAMINDALI